MNFLTNLQIRLVGDDVDDMMMEQNPLKMISMMIMVIIVIMLMIMVIRVIVMMTLMLWMILVLGGDSRSGDGVDDFKVKMESAAHLPKKSELARDTIMLLGTLFAVRMKNYLTHKVFPPPSPTRLGINRDQRKNEDKK